jgi:multidrug efflux pump subunit AcrA (membrane-fusion protein)
MVNDSVGALHVALAAAVVGWLVFVISHSFAVWKTRNPSGGPHPSRSLLYIGLLLCAAALAGGWLNRELTRRAGVILGTDFFVVRAHAKTTPHLIQSDSVDDGARIASFEDPEADREEEQLRGEIRVLEDQIASTRLKPLVLDPENIRLSEDASDSQRARLSQLGYGVLGASQAEPASAQALNEDDLVAAERAQSDAAKAQFVRTSALVQAGVISRDKLGAAEAAAQTAAKQLRERENLIQSAKAGSEDVAYAESEIRRDSERAKAERIAELAALDARLSELWTSLLQLQEQRSVVAPFGGTVVYRHPTPALVEDGKVILALAKGPGFLATVQLPAREASMLVPGRELRMKLKHSLVSEEVFGRLQSIQPVSGYPDRRDLLIECNLPSEQFAAFASGAIPVTLQWRPPLYSDRIAQAGLALALLPMIVWLFKKVRAQLTQNSAKNAAESERNWSEGWSYSTEEEELHQLGIRLGEGLRNQAPSSVVLKQVEPALAIRPTKSSHLVKTAVFNGMRQSEPAAGVPFAKPMGEDIDRVLAQLGLSARDLSAVTQ